MMMISEQHSQKDSNTQLLQELEALSQTMYQSHISSTRRTASLALPRSSIPSISVADQEEEEQEDDDNSNTTNQVTRKLINSKPSRARRMSLSPWRSRSNEPPTTQQQQQQQQQQKQKGSSNLLFVDSVASEAATQQAEKKKIWNWKPLRALSHIGMQKLSCLFSVEVVAVQGLPASMNGLRLSICVRKKETKDGAVQTMPSVVTQGAADFEETLFIKCHVYYNTPPIAAAAAAIKLDPRPFLIYVFAIDAPELDLGKSSVDVSRLIQESMEKTNEGTRIRQWDTSFRLSGKAKGGELAVKLGFQIMEKDGGIYYGQLAQVSNPLKSRRNLSTAARKQSKTSFSIPSPKVVSTRMEVWTPSSHQRAMESIPGFEDLNLDEEEEEPAAAAASSSPAGTTVQKPNDEPEPKPAEEDLDLIDIPDFDVVDKGIEIQEQTADDRQDLDNDDSLIRSESSEVVKEVVHDQFHLTRLAELDSIAQQIKALESMMGSEKTQIQSQQGGGLLDAEEETVTREFLQMLEEEESSTPTPTAGGFKHPPPPPPPHMRTSRSDQEEESKVVFLPDLGKGLGCVIQTKYGGYLAAMNPLQVSMARKETPKLAMQMSKPLVIITSAASSMTSGFELFQGMAADGFQVLSSTALSLMPTDDLTGKTPEQVAFEGIASAIIHGREKEGANSSAARTVAAVKTIANAMSLGRKERLETGIWNVSEDPVAAHEILPFSAQKIEAMLIDALKIQAGVAEEGAPFDVSPPPLSAANTSLLASAIPIDDWINNGNHHQDDITLAVLLQLHDPMRRYEAVGGTVMALIQAAAQQQEKKFKVVSIHIGGIKVSKEEQKRNHHWDGEKQRLTALQWLVAYGLARAGRKGGTPPLDGRSKMWSLSSRIMADMWLKPIRNPDVKFTK